MAEAIQEDVVCVPIEESLFLKLAERMPSGGVRSLLEFIAMDFLERTEEDWRGSILSEEEDTGIVWGPLFLNSGTRLMMEYRGIRHIAEIVDNSIRYEDRDIESPSQLARVIANNVPRNAWKVLWVRRPQDKEWIRAKTLREKYEEGGSELDLQKLFDKLDKKGA